MKFTHRNFEDPFYDPSFLTTGCNDRFIDINSVREENVNKSNSYVDVTDELSSSGCATLYQILSKNNARAETFVTNLKEDREGSRNDVEQEELGFFRAVSISDAFVTRRVEFNFTSKAFDDIPGIKGLAFVMTTAPFTVSGMIERAFDWITPRHRDVDLGILRVPVQQVTDDMRVEHSERVMTMFESFDLEDDLAPWSAGASLASAQAISEFVELAVSYHLQYSFYLHDAAFLNVLSPVELAEAVIINKDLGTATLDISRLPGDVLDSWIVSGLNELRCPDDVLSAHRKNKVLSKVYDSVAARRGYYRFVVHFPPSQVRKLFNLADIEID